MAHVWRCVSASVAQVSNTWLHAGDSSKPHWSSICCYRTCEQRLAGAGAHCTPTVMWSVELGGLRESSSHDRYCHVRGGAVSVVEHTWRSSPRDARPSSSGSPRGVWCGRGASTSSPSSICAYASRRFSAGPVIAQSASPEWHKTLTRATARIDPPPGQTSSWRGNHSGNAASLQAWPTWSSCRSAEPFSWGLG